MKLYIIFIVYFFLGCNHPENGQYERNLGKDETSNFLIEENPIPEHEIASGYKVVGVKDGDTFVILMGGVEQVVRFEHVDCPEKKQPFGREAKQFVSDRCFGKFLILKHDNKFDRNKRLIAEVILQDGINLNKELVKNGLAWHYKKYSKDKHYAFLDSVARRNKVGLWSTTNQIAPWEWRK